MELFDMFRQAGIVAIFSLIITLAPLAMGIVYAIQPSEARLALMRPISLAGIFAGLCGLTSGLIHILRFVHANDPIPVQIVALGFSEAMVPLFVGFGSLTVAWLLVAVGLRRQA
jgi:hypothetical protein